MKIEASSEVKQQLLNGKTLYSLSTEMKERKINAALIETAIDEWVSYDGIRIVMDQPGLWYVKVSKLSPATHYLFRFKIGGIIDEWTEMDDFDEIYTKPVKKGSMLKYTNNSMHLHSPAESRIPSASPAAVSCVDSSTASMSQAAIMPSVASNSMSSRLCILCRANKVDFTVNIPCGGLFACQECFKRPNCQSSVWSTKCSLCKQGCTDVMLLPNSLLNPSHSEAQSCHMKCTETCSGVRECLFRVCMCFNSCFDQILCGQTWRG